MTALLKDESPVVQITAAKTLCDMNILDESLPVLGVLENPNGFARCHALNAIDCIGEKSPEIVTGVVNMIKRLPEMDRSRYDLRAAKWLVEKWSLNPDDYELKLD